MPTPDPQRQFAVDVVTRLRDAGHVALWAGGCVRDFLLGITPKDYDVATNAVPEQVRKIFGRRATQTVGASFGVIIVHGPKGSGMVEVATFRTDGSYLDGRRPESVEFSTPEEDAQRRDFTINGMFYDPIEQKVHDYVGGEKDLSLGVIRAIGDPHDRVREDKLRMLRAIRFAATLDFELDETTAAAITEMAADIHAVSVERISQELKRMLVDRHRMRAMRLAQEVGLLAEFLPEIKTNADDESAWDVTLQMLHLLQEPSFELAAAALFHGLPPSANGAGDAAARLCKRLRLSNQETDRIAWLLENRSELHSAPDLPLSRLKRLAAHSGFDELHALVRVERLATNAELKPVVFVDEFLQRTPPEEINPAELLGGAELKQLGMTPGPRFREILTAVRDAQLNGELSTPEEALRYVERLQTNSLSE